MEVLFNTIENPQFLTLLHSYLMAGLLICFGLIDLRGLHGNKYKIYENDLKPCINVSYYY